MECNQKRTFFEWWITIPRELRDESIKSILPHKKIIFRRVNFILYKLHVNGDKDKKPSFEELKYWLNTGQLK